MSRFVVLALVLQGSVAHAADFHKGPWLQSVTPTGITVMWENDERAPGRVTVRSPGEPDRVVEAPSESLHEIRVEGLTPGRRYVYLVDSGGISSGGEFATAPESANEPFSFVVFGDSRSNADAHRALVERVRREVPDFILGTGDMVNEGVNQQDWHLFFVIERELLRDNVLYPSLGNHDRQGRARSADNFRKYFALPADSPDPERYYAFTYGNTRVFVLDSNSYSFALTDQTHWLEQELSRSVTDPRIRHRFVVMHHPPYSVSLHGGQPELREMWTPLFEQYEVDAVFSGHDHVYSRAERDGVRYFVSGGGGAPLYPRDPRPAKIDQEAVLYFERTFHFLRVHVSGDFVEVAAIRDDGTVIESLSWGTLPYIAASAVPAASQAQHERRGVHVAGPVVSSSTGGCASVPGPASPGGAFAVVVGLALALGSFLLTRRG